MATAGPLEAIRIPTTSATSPVHGRSEMRFELVKTRRPAKDSFRHGRRLASAPVGGRPGRARSLPVATPPRRPGCRARSQRWHRARLASKRSGSTSTARSGGGLLQQAAHARRHATDALLRGETSWLLVFPGPPGDQAHGARPDLRRVHAAARGARSASASRSRSASASRRSRGRRRASSSMLRASLSITGWTWAAAAVAPGRFSLAKGRRAGCLAMASR
jgi:hypothetical protein